MIARFERMGRRARFLDRQGHGRVPTGRCDGTSSGRWMSGVGKAILNPQFEASGDGFRSGFYAA